MAEPLKAVVAWFDDAQIEPLGAGHIHDTYRVTPRLGSSGDDPGRFVLQRVNQAVFADPGLVMAQTGRLLAHWSGQTEYRVPRLIEARDGRVLVEAHGHAWRMWEFLDHTRTVDPVRDTDQARAAGRAFGVFQRHMESLPGPRLEPTIAGFLDLDHYLERFAGVARGAPVDLARMIDADAKGVETLAVPNTHIHGDCKVNNLLFNPAGKRVDAVIDFDTAMYGHWAWDFGDLVRSVCFSRGGADPDDFAACLSGFASAQPRVTVTEAVAAPAYLALMLGVRFLTDHLEGDPYFRVTHPGDNLVRARQQFALLEAFTATEKPLRDAADALLKGGV